MNRTTGDSKQRNTVSIGGDIFQVTDRTLEVPPKKERNSTHIGIADGNMEVSAGSYNELENGKMKLSNGTIVVIDPKQMLEFAEYLKKKKIMEDKIAEIEKREKAQVGTEMVD